MEISIIKDFVSIECCNCGMIFFVSKNYKQHLQETLQSFYCPNGHCQSYTKSTANILKDEIELKNKSLLAKDNYILNLEKDLKKLKRKNKK